MTAQVLQGDCLEIMPTLPDASVDLIVSDPPYYRMKNDCAWDRQWEKPELFLQWIDQVLEQFHRLLKPNGSLYIFASPRMAARVEVLTAERFEVLNRIQWVKHDGTENRGGLWSRANKDILRVYFSQREEIIFAEHYGADSTALNGSGYAAKCGELRGFVFEPLRDYLDGERRRAGISKEDCNVACGFSPTPGGMASRHYFSQSQWWLPTKEHYEALQRLFNGTGGNEYLRREYEDLRCEYEDLRRPFNASPDAPYTDVWDFATVGAYPGKHPCEKPLEMIEHIITVSSRPGAIVLDAFAGSGVVGEAAIRLGRIPWLIELDPDWAEVCRRRVERADKVGAGPAKRLRAGVKDKHNLTLPLFAEISECD